MMEENVTPVKSNQIKIPQKEIQIQNTLNGEIKRIKPPDLEIE